MIIECCVMQSRDCCSIIFHHWLKLNNINSYSDVLCFTHFLGILTTNLFGFPEPFRQACNSTNMGCESRKVELMNCEELRSNTKVWEMLEKSGITIFIKKIHGWDPNITRFFAKEWKDDEINLFGRKVFIDEQLIVEVTWLSIEGIKFYKNRKFSD